MKLTCIIVFVFSFIPVGYSHNPVQYSIDTLKMENMFIVTETISIFDKNSMLVDENKIINKYNLSGLLIEHYSLKIGDVENGFHYTYHSNGNLNEFYNMILGRKTGIYLKYYDNGIVQQVGNYGEIKCIDEISYKCDTIIEKDYHTGDDLHISTCYVESLKNGIWAFYNEKGILLREEIWEKGILLQSQNR